MSATIGTFVDPLFAEPGTDFFLGTTVFVEVSGASTGAFELFNIEIMYMIGYDAEVSR